MTNNGTWKARLAVVYFNWQNHFTIGEIMKPFIIEFIHSWNELQPISRLNANIDQYSIKNQQAKEISAKG